MSKKSKRIKQTGNTKVTYNKHGVTITKFKRDIRALKDKAGYRVFGYGANNVNMTYKDSDIIIYNLFKTNDSSDTTI
jgi:hypothetical protein